MSDGIREAVRQSIGTRGATRTAKLLGLSTEATLRLAAGAGVQRGTELVAERNAHRLADVDVVGAARR